MTEDTDAKEPQKTESASCPSNHCHDQHTTFPSRVRDRSRPCDSCDATQFDELHEISLGERMYEVCDDCLQRLVDEIEAYHWWERLTEAHYDRAAEFLRSLDAVWCVEDGAYAGGELWVHTPYCDAAVVRDVCDHFGFQIRWFNVVYPSSDGFACVSEHGPCIEINLVYPARRIDPLPLKYDIQNDVTYHEVEWLDERHRLFDHPQ